MSLPINVAIGVAVLFVLGVGAWAGWSDLPYSANVVDRRGEPTFTLLGPRVVGPVGLRSN